MIIHDVDQRSELWYKLRLGKITGTGFSDVVAKGKGGSPSKTRATYLSRKLREHKYGRRFESGVNSYHMKRGVLLEDEGIEVFEFKTHDIVSKVGFVEFNEWIGVSPDGLIGDDGGIEIKCPMDTTHQKYLDADKITDYDWQVHGNMMVTGRKWWKLVSYHPDFIGNGRDDRMLIKTYERDEKKIDELRYECDRFAKELKTLIEGIRHGK